VEDLALVRRPGTPTGPVELLFGVLPSVLGCVCVRRWFSGSGHLSFTMEDGD
jgi:hypothetical protein